MRVLVSVCLFVSVACGGGWQPSTPSPHRPEGPVWTPPVVVEPAPTRPVRTGAVRLEGRAFADDGGPWNALGASLFWALWGERHDPDRLDANLAHLAEHGVDYVRILSMVGSETWHDRVIDPRAGDYWAVADRLFARLARHGLRVQVTVFADAQVMMPDARERELWLDAWVAYAEAHRAQVFLLEVANEYWQNGFADPEQVRSLGRRAQAHTSIPVALSAPPDDDVFSLYADWSGPATLHYDRNVQTDHGPWRPIRQPYGCWNEYREREHYTGNVPPVCVNNEPIGPHATVFDESDPLRLAMAYVTTFVVGNGAYVYHAGAGVRGGGQADLARGRFPNLYDYDHAILRAMSHWRATLPDGLPNWHRTAPHLHDFPWSGSKDAIDRGDVVRTFVALSGNQIVGAFLGMRRPHEATARVGLDLVLYHPVTGEALHRVDVNAGERFTIPADLPGYVVMGALR